MFNYECPEFSFAAPLEYATRFGANEPKNQPYRTDFMRDRDRVLYCSAFRRLAGKTQIYLTGKDDHQRNRLTHTLEVSQIARTISRALYLDCDLTEAIALGHDLGHTPFGHAGEQVLHEIMVPSSPIHITDSPMNDKRLTTENVVSQNLFGFKHNIQSIRVATSLESSYGKYGLNLTNFALWGILHHSSPTYRKGTVKTSHIDPTYRKQFEKHLVLPPSGNGKEAWSFEAFVVGQADEIAQWHHDLEDALRGQAMTSSEVCSAIKDNLGAIMSADDSVTLNSLKKRHHMGKKDIADISRVVVNTLVNRLIECSLYNLRLLWNDKVGDEEKLLDFLANNNWDQEQIVSAIGFKKHGEQDKRIDLFQREYPSVISEKIHHSQEVERMNAKGQYIIKKLFQAYYSHPQQLPDSAIIQYMIEIGQYKDLNSAANRGIGAVRVKFEKFLSSSRFTINNRIALMRKICDHIAGMTDHFAMEEYKNLYA